MRVYRPARKPIVVRESRPNGTYGYYELIHSLNESKPRWWRRVDWLRVWSWIGCVLFCIGFWYVCYRFVVELAR